MEVGQTTTSGKAQITAEVTAASSQYCPIHTSISELPLSDNNELERRRGLIGDLVRDVLPHELKSDVQARFTA